MDRDGDGKFVDVVGVEILIKGTYKGVEFTDENCMELANKYNVDYHEAQLNLGHPDEDQPAQYGAIERLYYEAPVLKADLCRVPEHLAEQMVHGGFYPYRSIEFTVTWVPDEEMGEGWMKPVPDYITGLALLGVFPPAVKGMKKVQSSQIIKPEEYPAMQVVSFSAADGDWRKLTDGRGADQPGQVYHFEEVPAMADNGKDVQEKTISLSEYDALKLKADTLLKEKEDREAKLAEAEKKAATVEQENIELAGAVTKLTESTNYLLEKASLAEKQARLSEAERFIEKLCADKGGSVAALANTNIVKVLAELDGAGTVMKLADDTEVSLADEVRAALSAIPKFDGEIEIAPVTDDEGEDGVHLTDNQKALAEVARIVANVTPEKFAEAVAETARERGGK